MNLFIAYVVVLTTCLPLLSLTHTINFMWINSETNSSQELIFPTIREKIHKGDDWNVQIVDDWLKPWLLANPRGHFVFWYDANTVTKKQLANTERLFASHARDADVRLVMKPVQDLRTVKNHPLQFSSAVPLYLRTDLLRLAAARETVDACTDDCVFVYVDVDKGLKRIASSQFEPIDLSADKLLDDGTLRGLKDFGLVLNTNQENNFFIVSNQNKAMLAALDEVVINANLLGMTAMLKRIDSVKERMLKGLATESELREMATEAINRIHASMVFPLMYYFRHVQRGVSMTPRGDLSSKTVAEALSEMPYAGFFKLADYFALDARITEDDVSYKNFPIKEMYGSSTVSSKARAPMQRALFGAELYDQWRDDYDRTSEQTLVARNVVDIVRSKKLIADDAGFEIIDAPPSSNANYVIAMSSGEERLLAHVYKNLARYNAETKTMASTSKRIKEIDELNVGNHPLPQFEVAATNFIFDDNGVIVRAPSVGKPVADYLASLATLSTTDITTVFSALGSAHGYLQGMYLAATGRTLYARNQNAATVAYDQATGRVTWRDVSFGKSDYENIGLLTPSDPDNYVADLFAARVIRDCARRGFVDGAQKYLVAVASIIKSYDAALKATVEADALEVINVEKNQRMEDAIDKMLDEIKARLPAHDKKTSHELKRAWQELVQP